MTTFDYESAYGDLDSFNGRTVQPGLAAERYVAEIGGLPEITRAALDLQTAINQTREEIESADFASRFSTEMTPRIREALDVSGLRLTHLTQDALENEGEAGAKRHELRTELTSVEGELAHLIARFVNLRAHLNISKAEL